MDWIKPTNDSPHEKKIKKLNKFKKDSFILDIGCSDPTFLDLLKKKIQNSTFLPLIPHQKNLETVLKKKGINLIVDYFSKKKKLIII